MKVCNKFLLGADPEFVIRSKADSPVSLARFFVDHELRNPLGYDHNGMVGECRPKPEYSSFKLVKNLREIILQKAPEEFEKLHLAGKWEAGGFKKFSSPTRPKVSLGGHVHFGVSIQESSAYWGDSPQTATGKRIVSNLDQLTTGLEDLDILSESESRERREESDYGDLGDIRFNGPEHFEYRSMCSWLYHPETAMVVLTLAKIVAGFPISISRRFEERPFSMQVVEDLIARGAQKHGDDDCLVVWERIINSGKVLQHKVDEDFRGAWEEFSFGKGVDL